MTRFARLPLAFVALLVTAALVAFGRRREDRATDRYLRHLFASGTDRPTRGHTDDLDALPDPVRRYFETVFGDDLPDTRVVRVEQIGDLRLGGRDSPWKRFTATHHATSRRPGFVWDATVDLAPLVSVRVRDVFVDGDGSARIALFGALPSNGVTWEPIDDHTARATLTSGTATASLTFHFSPEYEVERVHAESRYRRVDGGFEPTPWTGLWREYDDRDGVRVPTDGEVVWHLPDGDFHAWRGSVRTIDRRS